MRRGICSSRTRIDVQEALLLMKEYSGDRDADKIFVLVSIASVTISNSRRRLLTLSPNAFPAVRYVAKRDAGDDTPIEYIQVLSHVFRPDMR